MTAFGAVAPDPCLVGSKHLPPQKKTTKKASKQTKKKQSNFKGVKKICAAVATQNIFLDWSQQAIWYSHIMNIYFIFL